MTGGLGGGRAVPAGSPSDVRKVAAAAMAKVFAKAVVRVGADGGKKGAAAVAERRRLEVLEVFLRKEED